MSKVIIHTDGSGINRKNVDNSGHGGCGFVMEWKGHRKEHWFGSFRQTTSARMEIFAIIKALELCNVGYNIEIRTDNQYCRNTISHEWYERWILKDQSKANMDLWNRYKKIHDTHISGGSIITAVWIKGHANGKYPENEIADKLAYKGRINCKQIIDDRNGIYSI